MPPSRPHLFVLLTLALAAAPGCGSDEASSPADTAASDTAGADAPRADAVVDVAPSEDAGPDVPPPDAPPDAVDAETTDAPDVPDVPDVPVDAGPVELPNECGSETAWCDQAESAGLHVGGPRYNTTAAWADVDGDGWEDLWQGAFYKVEGHQADLWLNNRDGTFRRYDLALPESAQTYNWGATWGDVDGDGDPDLLLTNGGYDAYARLTLLRNDIPEGGGLTDVTEASGLSLDLEQWWNASFADYDRDGHLDVAVTALSTSIGNGGAPPDGSQKSEDARLLVFRGNGDGTFVDLSAELGLPTPKTDVKTPTWLDYDWDGDLDLFVGNTRQALWLLRNDVSDGGGFSDVTAAALGDLADPVISAAVADFDQDGHDDLYLARDDAQDLVLLSDGVGGFTQLGAAAGLDATSTDDTSAASSLVVAGDLNNDGWPDVVIGTGDPWRRGPPIVYCHDGSTDVSFTRCGADFAAQQGDVMPHSPALADFDQDGDLDVFWSLGRSPVWDSVDGTDHRALPALYINHQVGLAASAALRLVGSGSHTTAVGARVTVTTNDGEHHYAVYGATGWGSQSSAWLTVSLGAGTEAAVSVTWPSGATSKHIVAAAERLTIREPGNI